jgi:hypothetical protein
MTALVFCLTQLLMCSISTNVLMVLANLLGIIIQFFRKASVMTMATIVCAYIYQSSGHSLLIILGMATSEVVWDPRLGPGGEVDGI